MTDETKDMLKDYSASPAESQTTSPESGNLIDEPDQQTQEEVEFNSLKGSTQDRIKRIIREKNEALRIAEEARSSRTSFTPPPPPAYTPPDVETAVSKLDQVGIATKKHVEDVVSQSLGNLRFQMELDRLEGRFDGSDGKPKFVRDEYFDFTNRHPEYKNYLPEDVYEKMYKEELSDLGVPQAKKVSPTLKPTKVGVGEEPLSPELIEERLKEPDGRQWYERNLEKINKVLGKMSQG